MIKNYIKLAIRNLLKNKIFSAINVIGLSLGMAACIIILLFVNYEKGFDTIHTKNLYRLDEVQNFEGMTNPQKVALSMYPMGPTLKADFPEVKDYVRIHPYEMAGLVYKNNKIFLDNVYWTDPSFFYLFNYKLLRGDPEKVLSEPNTVVLTTESAEKLFGKEDPIGKSVSTYNRRDTLHFTITGIMENVSKNSHLQFDGLYSFSSLINPAKVDLKDFWGGNWVITYLELAKNTNVERLEKKFPDYFKKYVDEETANQYELFLQPLKDVHGTSGEITHDYHNFQKFDKSTTQTFLIIAIIVMLIACVNFINLSTAKSARRAKEVGVRKSIGAQRFQLTSQFMTESFLLSFIAMLMALILVAVSLPYVNQLSEHELVFSPFQQPALFLKLLLGTFFVGVLSGIYPALYLSSFKPVKVLKGVSNIGNTKSFTRNALVVGQFACAAFLIIAMIFVIRQLNFMQNKDAGFNKDQVIVISGAYNGYKPLKADLEANSLIKGVTGSSQSLGNNFHQGGFIYKGDGPERNLASSHVEVDEDFISLYEIKLLAGKNFSDNSNAQEYMINESLAKELLKDNPNASYESLIGDRFTSPYFAEGMDSLASIVAVTEDFNFNSLHTKVETLCIINYNKRGFHDVSVKIDGSRTKEAIAFVESTYKKNISTYPFDYYFLDDHFAQLYKNDQKVSKVVSILGGLAIIIACLGLLGLASFSAETRIKEIGVRKVLGASVTDIVQLLSKDFIKLVIIANLIAWPLAWWAVTVWLRDYAYHIGISLGVFALAGIVSLLIALISVSSQTFKAAVANPVKSLRTE